MVLILLFFLALSSPEAHAHKNHDHGAATDGEKKVDPQVLNKIATLYNEQVRSIFQQKCMDCHSTQTRYPWYYKLPFAKSLIDEDVEEAKKHLDIGEGYPFQGHGTYISDLEEIARTIREGTMPPFRYRVMHPSAGFTEEERKAVLRWIDESLLLLKGK